MATLVGAAFLGATFFLAATFFTGAGLAFGGATVFLTGADFFTVLVAVLVGAGAGANFLKSAFTCIVRVCVRAVCVSMTLLEPSAVEKFFLSGRANTDWGGWFFES